LQFTGGGVHLGHSNRYRQPHPLHLSPLFDAVPTGLYQEKGDEELSKKGTS
jgi:hypothetical protein